MADELVYWTSFDPPRSTSGDLWTTIENTGSPSAFDAAVARKSGHRGSLRITKDAGTDVFLLHKTVTAITERKAQAQLWVRFDPGTLASAGQQVPLVQIGNVASGAHAEIQLYNDAGTTKFRGGIWDGVSVFGGLQLGPTPTANTWTRLDLWYDSSTSTLTYDWRIDEVEQTQGTLSGTAEDITEVNVGVAGSGVFSASPFDAWLTDLTFIKNPTGWMAEGWTASRPVDAVGTHSVDATPSVNFSKDVSGTETALGNTGDTTSHQTIDDEPLDGDADHVLVRASFATDVAYDAATESVRTDTSDPYSFSHTGRAEASGGVQGVVVMVMNFSTDTNHVASVKYGTSTPVSLTEVRAAEDTAGETGNTQLWFVGSGLSGKGGTQTVEVDLTSGTGDDLHIVAVTLTGGGDLEVVDSDEVNNNTANPSVTLQYAGRTCITIGGIFSGRASVSDLTLLSGMSAVHDHDGGLVVTRVDRQTTPGSTDFTFGYTALSDDVALVAAAIGRVGVQPNSAHYLEYAFEDNTETDTIAGVRPIIRLTQDAAANCSITAKLRADGAESNIYSGDINSASDVYRSAFFTQTPASTAWDDTKYDGATLRWGYTADADGTPRLAGAMVEVLYQIAAAEPAAPLTTPYRMLMGVGV